MLDELSVDADNDEAERSNGSQHQRLIASRHYVNLLTKLCGGGRLLSDAIEVEDRALKIEIILLRLEVEYRPPISIISSPRRWFIEFVNFIVLTPHLGARHRLMSVLENTK